MSLKHYAQLQKNSTIQSELLGCVLPKLVAAKANLVSNTLDSATTIETIAAFDAQQGWVMYRDCLKIAPMAPTRSDFIEGEWNRDKLSLKVKLIAHDQYLVTKISTQETSDDEQAYSTQTVFLQKALLDQLPRKENAANYRLWWQKKNHGEHQGRWVPLAQQFMGFCWEGEIQ
jgi:hypothetical protein